MLRLIQAMKKVTYPELVVVEGKMDEGGEFLHLTCQDCGTYFCVDDMGEIKKHQKSCANNTLLNVLVDLEQELLAKEKAPQSDAVKLNAELTAQIANTKMSDGLAQIKKLVEAYPNGNIHDSILSIIQEATRT